MKRISALLGGIGLIALQACSVATQADTESLAKNENAVSASAYMTIPYDWGSGYNSHVFAVNPLTVTAKTWTVIVDLQGGSIQLNSSGQPNWWGAIGNRTSGLVSFTPTGSTIAVAPGTTAELFSFNTNVSGSSAPRAVIKAYNFKLDTFANCETNSGKKPAKAALAVAMANELGRWEPDQDLTISNGRVVVSPSAVCVKNNCANTKSLLGQQDYTPDQSIFNNVDFSSDLQASFQRQLDTLNNLKLNSPSKMPISDYKLTQIAGPVNLGINGACGPHYVFQVDYKSTGQPLSSTDATNLMATMCFYDGYGCGNGNPYLGYITTGITGCPSGKQCIAIDPTDGDNGSTSTTTAGSAPTYPFNRVYNPDNSLLGTACITTTGLYGTLISKCSTAPNTCGYLYCVAS